MLVFVYGTLRRGECSHHELGPARYVRDAITAPHYELVDLGEYPALLEGGGDAVRGELYEVPETWLAHLDWFEDVPTLYERKAVAVLGSSQESHESRALGYVMPREVAAQAPRIESGDWQRR